MEYWGGVGHLQYNLLKPLRLCAPPSIIFSSHFHWLGEFLAVCLSVYKYWASPIRQATVRKPALIETLSWRLEIKLKKKKNKKEKQLQISAIKVSDLFHYGYWECFRSKRAFLEIVLTVSRREHKAHGEIIEEAFFLKNFAADRRLGSKEALERLMTRRWSSRPFR